MSLSYQPLTPIRVIDPVTDVDSITSFAVETGGDQVSYKQYSSTSISNTSIQFSCPPPSSQVLVSRMVQLVIPVRLTFTGNVITTNGLYNDPTSLLNTDHDAPRAWPISGSLDSLRVGINNDSVSIPLSEVIHPLMQFGPNEGVRAKSWSMTPNMFDQSSNYSDVVGTQRNPLATYGESKQLEILPRGASQFTIVSGALVTPSVGAGTAATAIVDCLFTENIMVSPFYFGCAAGNQQAFYNVNSFDIDLNFQTQASRMWSHNAGVIKTDGTNNITTAITSVAMQFSGFTGPAFTYAQRQPLALFKYITPSYLDKQMLNPQKPITYGYSDIVRYPTSIGTLTYAQGAQPFTSNNLQLNQIPRRMYVFARPARSVLESRTDITDTYLAIQNISVQFANASVLLSTASQQSLYLMNVKNGYQGSWAQFTGQLMNGSNFASPQYSAAGAPLCLEFGSDLQLAADEAPGLLGQYMVQVQVSLKNTNIGTQWDAIPFELVLVIVNEGVFTITGQGSASHQLGVLTKSDILNAQQMPGLRQDEELRGSGLMDSIGSFGSKVNQFLKDSKLLSTIAPLIPLPGAGVAGKIASNLGYGVIGGCGENALGGAMISKKSLRRSLADRG